MSLYRLPQGTPGCNPDPEVATGVAQCLRLPTRKAGRTGTSVDQLEEKDNMCWKEDRGKNIPEEQPEDALGSSPQQGFCLFLLLWLWEWNPGPHTVSMSSSGPPLG